MQWQHFQHKYRRTKQTTTTSHQKYFHPSWLLTLDFEAPDVNNNGIIGDEGFCHQRSMLQAPPHNLFLQKKTLIATQGIASVERDLGGIMVSVRPAAIKFPPSL
jgi:hypothetical protein